MNISSMNNQNYENNTNFKAKLILKGEYKNSARLKNIAKIFEEKTSTKALKDDVLAVDTYFVSHKDAIDGVSYITSENGLLEYSKDDNVVANKLKKLLNMSKKRREINVMINKFFEKLDKKTGDNTLWITYSDLNGYTAADSYIHETIQKDKILKNVIKEWNV